MMRFNPYTPVYKGRVNGEEINDYWAKSTVMEVDGKLSVVIVIPFQDKSAFDLAAEIVSKA